MKTSALDSRDSRFDLFGFGVNGLELAEYSEGVVGATGAEQGGTEPQANGCAMGQPRLGGFELLNGARIIARHEQELGEIVRQLPVIRELAHGGQVTC